MKNLLLLLSVSLTQTYAQQDFFTRNKNIEKHSIVSKSSIPNLLSSDLQRTTGVVPTLIKYSNWDNTALMWSPQLSYKVVYLNDLPSAAFIMSYNESDTFNYITYTYNSNKQIFQEVYYSKTSLGTLIYEKRYTYSYPNNSKMVITGENYDYVNNQWEYISRDAETYNSRGVVIAYTSERFINNQWELQTSIKSNIVYLNSSTNKIVERVDSSYDFNSLKFIAMNKTSKTYNSSDELIEQRDYTRETNGLVPFVLDSFEYANGKISTATTFLYDTTSMSFKESLKLTGISWKYFNPNVDINWNEPDGYTISYWDMNQWNFAQRNSTTYPDNNGSFINVNENYEDNQWKFSNSMIRLKDANQNIIEDANQYYNDSTNTWVYHSRKLTHYLYDNNNNIIEYYNETKYEFDPSFIKQEKYEFSNYITITLGVNTFKNTIDATIFPNPSNNGTVSINVNTELPSEVKIIITDLKGGVVLIDERVLGKGVNTMQLNNLVQGMYIVELRSEYGITRQKLAVK